MTLTDCVIEEGLMLIEVDVNILGVQSRVRGNVVREFKNLEINAFLREDRLHKLQHFTLRNGRCGNLQLLNGSGRGGERAGGEDRGSGGG